MRPRKIRVVRRSSPQIRRDLPPVHLHHFTGQIEHRDNQRAIEVLVPRLLVAQDAKLLEPRPLRVAGGAVRRRQMQTQRAVGVTQLEAVDDFARLKAALDEIPLRLRRVFQRPVVVVHHRSQQLFVVRRGIDQRRQLRHRGDLHHRPSRWRIVPFQQLQRMMEAHPLGPHHPQKNVAALAASALATPHILYRVDVQARVPVVVERAQPDKLLAAARQFDPPRLGQPLDRHLALEPLFHLGRNVGHP